MAEIAVGRVRHIQTLTPNDSPQNRLNSTTKFDENVFKEDTMLLHTLRVVLHLHQYFVIHLQSHEKNFLSILICSSLHIYTTEL